MCKELITRTNKLDGKTPMFVSRPTRQLIKNMHKNHQVRLWCKRNLIMLTPPAVVPHPIINPEADKPVVHLKKRVNAHGIEQDEDETWSSEDEASEEEDGGSEDEEKKKLLYTMEKDENGNIQVVREEA